MSKPNDRGIPPEDVEALIQRHVRMHVRNAVRDLRAAADPLRERTIYAGSPLLREIEEAHRAAEIAERSAERWRLRIAPQGELGQEPPPECFDLDAGEGAEVMRRIRAAIREANNIPEDPESEV